MSGGTAARAGAGTGVAAMVGAVFVLLSSGAPPRQIASVRWEVVRTGQVTDQLHVLGWYQAPAPVVLDAAAAGQLALSPGVEVGAAVRAGQQLGRVVDPALADAVVVAAATDARANAAVIVAQAAMSGAELVAGSQARGDRSATTASAATETLIEDRATVAEAQAAAVAAAAAAQQATAASRAATVVSPVAGVVSVLALGSGSSVQVGTNVVTVTPASASGPDTTLVVPPGLIAQVRPGDTVTFPGARRGTVTYVPSTPTSVGGATGFAVSADVEVGVGPGAGRGLGSPADPMPVVVRGATPVVGVVLPVAAIAASGNRPVVTERERSRRRTAVVRIVARSAGLAVVTGVVPGRIVEVPAR